MKLDLVSITSKLPSVIKPTHKLTFKEKMKWTALILLLYYILGSIVVWGVNPAAVSRFEFLEIVFGSKMGSLMTLGIGPIVTASIILQLLVGSKIIKWDMTKEEDKAKFTGTQKLMSIAFCVFEAVAYVVAGAIPPAGGGMMIMLAVILQLTVGGIIVIFMDEVCSKWGIYSGISLFIAAGVSKTIFLGIFNPLSTSGTFPSVEELPVGILTSIPYLLGLGQPAVVINTLMPLIATLLVFVIVIYSQAMRIEIPMSFALPFGKFASRRWPLKFIYTSNIPVILTAAVLANIQVMGKMLYSKGITFLGEYDTQSGQATKGLMYYVSIPNGAQIVIPVVIGGALALFFGFIALKFLKKYSLRMSFLGGLIGLVTGYFLLSFLGAPSVSIDDVLRSLTYMILMILGSVVFSKFWVMTSGMDAHTIAEQFKSSSIMIPGFRHDPRIVEKILQRYIPVLAVLGGAFVGFLAGFADLTNALGSGTGILLTVMIVYQIYEHILSQHYDDMPEFLKKFMGG